MNPADQFLQAFQGTAPVRQHVFQRCLGQVLVPAELVAGQAQPGQDRNEFLLHTVVDIAFQPTAPGGLGVHEAGP